MRQEMAWSLIGVFVAAGLAGAGEAGKAEFVTPADLKWVDDPAGSGVKTAIMWGDPKKGPYGGYIKFPAGIQVPLHHHTHENKGLVVSGTFVVKPEGGVAHEMGAGSYLVVPGGVKHTTACKAGADCVIFGQQPGPDDMIPSTPPPAK